MKMKTFTIIFAVLFTLFCASIEVFALDTGVINAKGVITGAEIRTSNAGTIVTTGTVTAEHIASTDDIFAVDGITAGGNLSAGGNGDIQGDLDVGGDVGIGTTSPDGKLQVLVSTGVASGALFTTSDFATGVSGSGLSIRTGAATGDTYTIVQALDQGGLTGGVLVFNPSGTPVGVGTATPIELLQVGDGGATDQYLSFQTSNFNERGIRYYLLDGVTTRGEIVWNASEDLHIAGDAISFSVQGADNALSIDEFTGNVSVGYTLSLLSGASIDEISTDGTMAGDSDTAVPTEKAVKAYADSVAAVGTLDIDADTGTPGTVLVGTQTFTLNGTTNEIETAVALQDITIGLPNAVTISGIMTAGTHTAGAGGVNSSGDITATASDLYIDGITSILGDWVTGGDIECVELTADRWNSTTPNDTWLDLSSTEFKLRVTDEIIIQYIDTTQNILELGDEVLDIDISLNDDSVFVQGSDGFVGISDATPSTPFSVVGTNGLPSHIAEFYADGSGFVQVVIDTATGEDAQLSFEDAGTGEWSIGNDGTDDSFNFQTGGGAFSSPEVKVTTDGDIALLGNMHIGGAAESLESLVVGDLNENINTGEVLIVGNTSGDSHFMFAQDATHGLTGTWDYEAVAANAEAYINTFGYSNNLHINAKTLTFQDGGGTAEGFGIGLINPAYEFDLYSTNTTFAMNIFNDGDSVNNAGIRIQCGEDTPSADNTFIGCYDGNGSVLGAVFYDFSTSLMAVGTPSDRKLKEGITTSTRDAIQILGKVRVANFRLKGQPGEKTGFIAQELEAVYPDAVTTHSYSVNATPEDRDKDGYTTRTIVKWVDIQMPTTKTIILDDLTTATRFNVERTSVTEVVHTIENSVMMISPMSFVPVLVQATQQQQKQIKFLKNQVIALWAAIAAILSALIPLLRWARGTGPVPSQTVLNRILALETQNEARE